MYSVQGTGLSNAYGQLLLPSACIISDSYVKKRSSQCRTVFQCQEIKEFSVQWQPKCHCQAAIISDLALRVLQEVSSLYCIVVIATTALFDSLNMNAGNEDLEDVSSKLRAIPEETEQASLGVFRTPVRRSARLRG